MKYIYFFFMFLFCLSNLSAQIPNAGFESWTDENTPDAWLTNNLPPSWITVQRSSDANSGSFAARLQIVEFSSFPIFPVLSTTFPVDQAYAALNGVYQFHPSIAESRLIIVVYYFNDGSFTGGGGIEIETAATVYTPFNADLVSEGAGTPDSAWIQIQLITEEGANPGIGSYAIIDQLSFGAATDVNDVSKQPEEFKLMQNYPNPFNPTTLIKWQAPVGAWQTLKVYDILGNEVATLVDEYREAGIYEIDFNAAELTSGVYFYQVKSGPNVLTRKMILMR